LNLFIFSKGYPVEFSFLFYRCEIDSGQSAFNVKIKSLNNQPLLFEMIAGFHTQTFISEIFKLTDTIVTRKASPKTFLWLDKYKKLSSGTLSLDITL